MEKNSPSRDSPLEAADKLDHDEKQPSNPTQTPINPPEETPAGALSDSTTDEKHLGPQSIPRLRFIALSTGVALGLFLSMLDSSIVATSLFTIAAEFGDVDSINWVALAYTLTYLSCAVLFARVSDVVGRHAAFAAAYVVFIVFSIACGFASGMGQLIAFRALQGVGGSACR
ncbi:hypothetical protein CHGG_04593 [Chaetomium globosum CBS 148.51]|uniref:Major facilitator superfamily (MFS) profile domain-containing protein n=1 Tax=Chaetomium globosum (strain ATCC 6205 / CBS 148.51 / DSM 1962 / NBRC 6347 / NRRL 1970) TaxID=306901 RepID=Q2H0V3_CHAGB|nr:uncharacterized protein CHGG_04593 [Chaetomium globosum CBS 148.51]EAQ87974.1 hypothetical protein CHGG_04593 [Chaetomium globosum CBS 148.51]